MLLNNGKRVRFPRFIIEYRKGTVESKEYIYFEKEVEAKIRKLKYTQGISDYQVIECEITEEMLQIENMMLNQSKEDVEEYLKNPLEAAIKMKIKAMSNECKKNIYQGIDVEVSDGEGNENVVKHFSLTEHDQMNIANLTIHVKRALSGEDTFIDPALGVPYHADGELRRFYSLEDFLNISEQATKHINYNTTYHNHLKQYIKSCTDKDEVANITYGIELPEDLQKNFNEILGL